MNKAPPSSRGKMVNSFDPAALDSLDGRTRRQVERRAALLGPAYRLFYRTPVEVLRVRGQVVVVGESAHLTAPITGTTTETTNDVGGAE